MQNKFAKTNRYLKLPLFSKGGTRGINAKVLIRGILTHNHKQQT